MIDNHNEVNQKTESQNAAFRRGDLCKLNSGCTEKQLLSAHTRLFIVMKVIDEFHVLVAPITSTVTAKKALEVDINSRSYFVRVMVLISASVKSLDPVTKMWLEDPSRVVSEIYRERTRILEESRFKKSEAKNKPTQKKKKAKKRDSAEERAWKDVCDRNQDARKALSRMNAPKRDVPGYLSWNATHPFQGGNTNPK